MIPCRAACASDTEDVLWVLTILLTAPYFLFFFRWEESGEYCFLFCIWKSFFLLFEWFLKVAILHNEIVNGNLCLIKATVWRPSYRFRWLSAGCGVKLEIVFQRTNFWENMTNILFNCTYKKNFAVSLAFDVTHWWNTFCNLYQTSGFVAFFNWTDLEFYYKLIRSKFID